MNVLGRIELAHEPDFVIGRLTVSPSRRELLRDDGQREIIEHRVMQVLVALSKVVGDIVTRDELIMQCWGGRVVGEDAVHRVMSRLRKSANCIGAGSIEIETITKIGYRLISSGDAATNGTAARASMAAVSNSTAFHPTRREMLVGTAAVGALAAVGGGAYLYRRITRPSVPPEIEALMIEADQAQNQATREGQNQSIALYRRVVQMAPEFADGWGLLGFAYALPSRSRPRAESEMLRARAEAAGQRALQIDPGNANGELALAVALPEVGHWQQSEQRLKRALAADPDNNNVRWMLGAHRRNVGRSVEAAALYQGMARRGPVRHYGLVKSLWAAGRHEEAERAMDEATSLYPTHSPLWHLRFDMRVFGGRPTAALAMLEDVEGRPTFLDDVLVDEFRALAIAVHSRDPALAEAVTRQWRTNSRQTVNDAMIAIRVTAALDRLNDAFDIAFAFHLGRGFTVPVEQNRGRAGADVSLDQRPTEHLFEPATSTMRADPRFNRLVEEIGLERYWSESGVEPDYRRLA